MRDLKSTILYQHVRTRNTSSEEKWWINGKRTITEDTIDNMVDWTDDRTSNEERPTQPTTMDYQTYICCGVGKMMVKWKLRRCGQDEDATHMSGYART